MALHEYYRHLYPSDPYIPFDSATCPTERLYTVTENCIHFLQSSNRFGHYPLETQNIENIEVKQKTGHVYGALWNKFCFDELTTKAENIVRERLEKIM